MKGAQFMSIAGELEKHAGEELSHAITITKQMTHPECSADGHAEEGENIEQSDGHALRFDLCE